MTSADFFFKIYLFIVGCAESWLLCGLFSSCGKRAPLVVVHRLAVVSLVAVGSVVVTHGLCYSEACGIFLDQGSNLCLLHWQEDF